MEGRARTETLIGRNQALLRRGLIPRLSDQDPWAQLRSPMDMMVHG
jgi:hypothetical protein